MMPGQTPSQTVGPFFAYALTPELYRYPYRSAVIDRLVQSGTEGRRIRIEGRVLDGDGLPVADALVEIWQANAHGRYHHPADTGTAALDPAFTGFGRSGTDDEGRYWFETVRPGRVPFDDHRLQASHIVVTVFARGLLNHAVTRLYFGDDPTIASDPILALVPESRRATLLAQPTEPDQYRFDIRLQGEGETVFFDL